MKTFFITSAVLFGAVLSAPSAFAQGADPINKGPLNVFHRESLHCGGGWTFPGLVWGDRPLYACMYKTKKKNVFGGDF